VDPYRERLAAFEAWWQKVRSFQRRPFPTDWAVVVAGVGLASFSMRAERSLSTLASMGDRKPAYLHRIGRAQSMTEELEALLGGFDRFLPALPPEPRSYFDAFRLLVVEAVELTETWWALPEPETTT